MQPAEPERRGNHQQSPRPRALPLDRAFGFLDIAKDAAGAFQIACADIGERYRPRGTLEQPRAQALFQWRNQPRDARWRQAELARGRRKALQIGDGDKGLHGIETIHGIISYIATVKCQSGRLFKIRKSPCWRPESTRLHALNFRRLKCQTFTPI